MSEIVFASARSMADQVRAGQVSAVELVEAHLRRIEEVNPRLNAVVQLAAERALEEAGEADEARTRGELMGPLHGVPITLKDSLDTAGVVSTGGTNGRAGFVPERDATVVARLRSAGAILLGKTNTPELTMGFETDNLVYGRTNNPYDLGRTPGGSSGGAAAIVAVGGSPLDLGSDTGGSIRVPAHFCGLAGIKPTSGRVPRTGHIIPFGMGARDSLTQIGPLARYVEDLILALPIISGPDWRDPGIVPVPLGDPAKVDIEKLRVAVYTDNPISTPTPETVEAVRAAAESLSEAGAFVDEDAPDVAQVPEAVEGGIPSDEMSVRRLLDRAGTTEPHPWTVRSMENSKPMTASELGEARERVDGFRSQMLSFMEAYDVLLSPVSPFPARPHGEALRDRIATGIYTRLHNLTGWPAAVVRAGTSAEGLPIGVQVAARPWREDVALAVAGHVETALGGWRRPPL